MKLVFKTIEEVQEYASRLTLTRFDTFRDYVDNATVRYIAPYLNGRLYERLADYLDGSALDDDALNALTPYVRRAVAYYAVFAFVRSGGVLITSAGAQKTETDTHKSSSFADKMDAANYYAESADAAMDALLTFLDEHRSEYPDYTPAIPKLLLRSAAEYNKFVNIAGSRRTYLALALALRDVELFFLKPLLGAELLETLRKYAAGEVVDVANKDELLQLAQAAAANMSMARAMPMLTLRFTDGAIGVASFYSPSQMERLALERILNDQREQFKRTAQTYLDELTNLLRTPADNGAHLLTNRKDSKHFVTPYIV